jgi:hypothetical protein
VINPVEHLAANRDRMLYLVAGVQMLPVTLQRLIGNYKFPASPEQQSRSYYGCDREGLQRGRRVSFVRSDCHSDTNEVCRPELPGAAGTFA